MSFNFTFSCSHVPSLHLNLKYLGGRCDLFQVLFLIIVALQLSKHRCQPGQALVCDKWPLDKRRDDIHSSSFGTQRGVFYLTWRKKWPVIRDILRSLTGGTRLGWLISILERARLETEILDQRHMVGSMGVVRLCADFCRLH